ncbi:MAG TPA: serine hydrolase [Chitinophagaceae bacterium]|nr:serine hydrolase [Chitinophagaceae bacterium]
MTRNRTLILLLLLLSFCCKVTAQKTGLPRSTPEAEGVSSSDIIHFLDATSKSKTEFHSFMLLRHGKVIAEGWWNPYRADLKHTLYSCSKSFTATAVGFAVTEKKLSLADRVISFFPNDLPDTVSRYLSQLTVKDVLIMSDGQEPDPTGSVGSKYTNWVKGFLATPIIHEPGSVFLYNSLGTYMLSAIVQKVTGQRIVEYLKPRLFDPLGIRGMDWEMDMEGINTGGWGLRLKTEDMAKFAQLFLQKGKWNGRQILPASWIEEASTMKILQDPNAPQSRKDSSDWLQGYCYQMWRCRHNAFRGDGAFGQFMIVMPEQDAVLAITAETPDMQEEINLAWKYLLPAFKSNKLPINTTAHGRLKQKIHSLALPPPQKNTQPLERTINGKSFTAASNAVHLQTVSFNFSSGVCRVRFQTDTAAYGISFGAGNWKAAETNMPEPALTAGLIANNSMIYPAKIMAGYTWKDANTLLLVLRYIESPHTETFSCRFHDDKLTIEATRSFDYGKNKLVVEAQQNR